MTLWNENIELLDKYKETGNKKFINDMVFNCSDYIKNIMRNMYKLDEDKIDDYCVTVCVKICECLLERDNIDYNANKLCIYKFFY